MVWLWEDSPSHLRVSTVFVFILFYCRKLLRIFLRLTESHNGKYLASRLADCLKRFGLKEFVSYRERYNCNSCLIMTTAADAMYGQCRKLQYNGEGAPGHHPSISRHAVADTVFSSYN
jgi:hypothetical protein